MSYLCVEVNIGIYKGQEAYVSYMKHWPIFYVSFNV